LERGTAKFILKEVVDDLNEDENAEDLDDGETKAKIKYGIIIYDGDNIREE